MRHHEEAAHHARHRSSLAHQSSLGSLDTHIAHHTRPRACPSDRAEIADTGVSRARFEQTARSRDRLRASMHARASWNYRNPSDLEALVKARGQRRRYLRRRVRGEAQNRREESLSALYRAGIPASGGEYRNTYGNSAYAGENTAKAWPASSRGCAPSTECGDGRAVTTKKKGTSRLVQRSSRSSYSFEI